MIKRKELGVAIIGGAGFVGTRLARRFDASLQPYSIFDIDQKTRRVQLLDVEDLSSFSPVEGHDSIINLAAVHQDNVRPVSRYDQVNVVGAKNVCNAARKYGIKKIIFTSSVAVYGFSENELDEGGDISYFNDYGRTKFEAEKVYKNWQEEDPLNRALVIVRPTVIFGEGNRGNVFNLLNQIATKRFLMVGSGNNKKSMAYVENIAAFLQYVLTKEKGIHIYNYVDKPDYSMNELVLRTKQLLFKRNTVGIRVPRIAGRALGLLADFLSLATRVNLPVSSIRIKKFESSSIYATRHQHIDFSPPLSLEEGLERTLQHEFDVDLERRKAE